MLHLAFIGYKFSTFDAYLRNTLRNTLLKCRLDAMPSLELILDRDRVGGAMFHEKYDRMIELCHYLFFLLPSKLYFSLDKIKI